jgi:hypothetical protein
VTRDPEPMTVPPTPKPTRKTEALTRATPTIASRREEDAVMKEVTLPRYRYTNCILETKTKVGITTVKIPVSRTNPDNDEVSTTSKPPTHPSHLETPPAHQPRLHP